LKASGVDASNTDTVSSPNVSGTESSSGSGGLKVYSAVVLARGGREGSSSGGGGGGKNDSEKLRSMRKESVKLLELFSKN
jgi:hypothetical protein